MIAYTPINKTGYGIASINILKALYLKDNNISYFPIGQPSVDNQEDYNFLQSVFNNQISADFSQPCLKIWHQFELATRIGKGKYFAYPFFELDTFNKLEKNHMSVPDHLFVSSEWAKNVMKQNGIQKDITVVPLGVDMNIFDYKKYSKNNTDKYIFSNLGKWEVRKGHDFLYDVFIDTFPDEKNVELWLLASEKTNNYSSPEDLVAWKKMYSKDPRVKVFTGFNGHDEIANFISQIDCGVFPSRAEGWNLELLECMAMNKPVICTDYTAHTEFCNKDNALLIPIDSTEPAYDGKAFQRQGNWGKIDSKQINLLQQYMRHCYEERISENAEGIKMAKKLSWNNTANIIYGCIQD